MKRTPEDLTIFVDGACRGNPGPAGIGVVIRDGQTTLKSIAQSIGSATNNIAEYTALIRALEESSALKARSLDIFTDSELMFKQVTGAYKVRSPHIKELFDQVKQLAGGFESVRIQHIPREQNKEADRLASGAIEQEEKRENKTVGFIHP